MSQATRRNVHTDTLRGRSAAAAARRAEGAAARAAAQRRAEQRSQQAARDATATQSAKGPAIKAAREAEAIAAEEKAKRPPGTTRTTGETGTTGTGSKIDPKVEVPETPAQKNAAAKLAKDQAAALKRVAAERAKELAGRGGVGRFAGKTADAFRQGWQGLRGASTNPWVTKYVGGAGQVMKVGGGVLAAVSAGAELNEQANRGTRESQTLRDNTTYLNSPDGVGGLGASEVAVQAESERESSKNNPRGFMQTAGYMAQAIGSQIPFTNIQSPANNISAVGWGQMNPLTGTDDDYEDPANKDQALALDKELEAKYPLPYPDTASNVAGMLGRPKKVSDTESEFQKDSNDEALNNRKKERLARGGPLNILKRGETREYRAQQEGINQKELAESFATNPDEAALLVKTLSKFGSFMATPGAIESLRNPQSTNPIDTANGVQTAISEEHLQPFKDAQAQLSPQAKQNILDYLTKGNVNPIAGRQIANVLGFNASLQGGKIVTEETATQPPATNMEQSEKDEKLPPNSTVTPHEGVQAAEGTEIYGSRDPVTGSAKFNQTQVPGDEVAGVADQAGTFQLTDAGRNLGGPLSEEEQNAPQRVLDNTKPYLREQDLSNAHAGRLEQRVTDSIAETSPGGALDHNGNPVRYLGDNKWREQTLKLAQRLRDPEQAGQITAEANALRDRGKLPGMSGSELQALSNADRAAFIFDERNEADQRISKELNSPAFRRNVMNEIDPNGTLRKQASTSSVVQGRLNEAYNAAVSRHAQGVIGKNTKSYAGIEGDPQGNYDASHAAATRAMRQDNLARYETLINDTSANEEEAKRTRQLSRKVGFTDYMMDHPDLANSIAEDQVNMIQGMENLFSTINKKSNSTFSPDYRNVFKGDNPEGMMGLVLDQFSLKEGQLHLRDTRLSGILSSSERKQIFKAILGVLPFWHPGSKEGAKMIIAPNGDKISGQDFIGNDPDNMEFLKRIIDFYQANNSE